MMDDQKRINLGFEMQILILLLLTANNSLPNDGYFSTIYASTEQSSIQLRSELRLTVTVQLS